MAQIINSPGRSAMLGQSLGGGLAQALQSLAESKVQDLNRQYQHQLFQQQYPGYEDLLSLYSGQPNIQYNIMSDLNKQRAFQQEQAAEEIALSPESLLAQGVPQALVGQIAGVSDPKYKKLLLENYLKQQNKPIGVGEALAAGLRNYIPGLPGISRLPGLGQEQRAQQEAQGNIIEEEPSRPLFPTARTPVNTSPSSGPVEALKALAHKPALAATGIGEGLLGLPGALLSLPSTAANQLSNLLGFGNVATPYSEIPEERQRILNEAVDYLGLPEGMKSVAPSAREAQLPTPSEVRKTITKPLSEVIGTEAFIPTSEAENAVTNVFQEAAPEIATALSSGGIVPIAKGVGKALSRSFGANTAGWLAQDITGSERAGNVVKIGTYLLSSMFPTRIRDAAKNRYEIWNEAIENTSNKEVPLDSIQSQLKHIHKEVRGMDKNSPAAKFMYDRLGAFEDKLHVIQKGQQGINIDTLADLRKSQNALYNDAVRAGAVKPYSELLRAEKDLMGEWARNNGKTAAFKAFEQGNEIHGALAETTGMNSFMQDVAKARSLSFGAGMLLGGIPAIVKAGIVSGFGIQNIFQTMKSLLKVPAIRQEYYRLLKASAQQNAKAVAISAHRLDDMVKKVAPKIKIEE